MSLSIKTQHGALPLHSALLAVSEDIKCINQARLSTGTIKFLIQAWPDAVREQDDHGYLPLHYACERGFTYDVLRNLVECWPMSVRIRTRSGALLLRLALISRS